MNARANVAESSVMPRSLQLNLPPAQLKRVDGPARERGAQVNHVDLADIEHARAAIGRAVAKALMRSGSPLKRFGDKGQVSRWTQGENPNLAKLWLCASTRREFVLALAEESGMSVEVTVRAERIA